MSICSIMLKRNVVPAVQNIEYYPKFWRPSSCLSNSPCIPLPPDYCLVARATKISNAQKQPPDEKLVLQQCGINRTIQIHQSRVIICHIQLNNRVFLQQSSAADVHWQYVGFVFGILQSSQVSWQRQFKLEFSAGDCVMQSTDIHWTVTQILVPTIRIQVSHVEAVLERWSLVASMYYMKYLTPKYFNRNSIMTELILHVYQVLKTDIKIIFTAYGKQFLVRF